MCLARTGTAWYLGTWERRPVAAIHSTAVAGYVCQRSYKSHGHVNGPHELSVIQSTRSNDHAGCPIIQFTRESSVTVGVLRRHTRYTYHTSITKIYASCHTSYTRHITRHRHITSYSIHHTSTTHNALLRHTNVISNYTIDVTLRYFVTLLCTHPGGLAAPHHYKCSLRL